MTLWFDMDGTLANLYGVDSWLDKIQAQDASPYADAAVLWNMSQLARALNRARRAGCELGIISWLAKSSTPEYDTAVRAAKLDWLNKHLHSVGWDAINIVAYGTPKQDFMTSPDDILFDDENKNRENWLGAAYEPNKIMEVLKAIAA